MRTDPFSLPNWRSIEIVSRGDYYAPGPVTVWDQNAIRNSGLRVGPTVSAHEICDTTVGQAAIQLILQRELYIRNTYQFKLSAEFCLLDPMDIVTLTDPLLGLNNTAVRITEIEEDDNGDFAITAEEFPAGVATGVDYPTQARFQRLPGQHRDAEQRQHADDLRAAAGADQRRRTDLDRRQPGIAAIRIGAAASFMRFARRRLSYAEIDTITLSAQQGRALGGAPGLSRRQSRHGRHARRHAGGKPRRPVYRPPRRRPPRRRSRCAMSMASF